MCWVPGKSTSSRQWSWHELDLSKATPDFALHGGTRTEVCESIVKILSQKFKVIETMGRLTNKIHMVNTSYNKFLLARMKNKNNEPSKTISGWC